MEEEFFFRELPFGMVWLSCSYHTIISVHSFTVHSFRHPPGCNHNLLRILFLSSVTAAGDHWRRLVQRLDVPLPCFELELDRWNALRTISINIYASSLEPQFSPLVNNHWTLIFHWPKLLWLQLGMWRFTKIKYFENFDDYNGEIIIIYFAEFTAHSSTQNYVGDGFGRREL